jgi:uncharacterized membrane protein YfcA
MPTVATLQSQPDLLAVLIVAAFLVGLSKGGMPAIGMLSVPLLSLFMSPLKAAVLLLPLYLLADMVAVYLYRREYSLPNIKILIPAGLIGSLIGWATATIVSDAVVALMIGVMGIVFCLYRWLSKAHAAAATPVDLKKGIFWGTISGFTSFVAHAGGPPFQIYTLPQKMPKMVFAGTSVWVFAALNLSKVVPYHFLNPSSAASLKASLLLIPAAGLGTLAGRQLIKRLPETWFYLAVQIALFLISIRLVVSVF